MPFRPATERSPVRAVRHGDGTQATWVPAKCGGALGEPEGRDVRQGGRVEVEVEDLPGQQRRHCPLLAQGVPNQRINGDQENELGQVLPQPQRNDLLGASAPPGSEALR